MKRSLILASAAIVALASCAKTDVVYTDAPEAIAFKQVSGPMTKAALSGDLGVFADKTGGDTYFDNTQFTNTGSAWTSDKLWPYEGTLDFTVYAPYNAESEYTDNLLTLKNVTAGETIYYGEQRYVGKSKEENATTVNLKHASAKLEVTLKGASVYTVTSLTVSQVYQTGNVKVTYNDGIPNYNAASVTTESSTAADASFTITNGTLSTDNTTALSPVYVLPGNQTTFEITFTQDNGENDVTFTKEIDLGETTWAANTAYAYTITITAPDAIQLNATVVDSWDSGTSADYDNDDLDEPSQN